MNTIWSDKTVSNVKVIAIILLFSFILVIGFLFGIRFTIISLTEPREVSLAHNLPNSATDVNEKTDYLRLPPDEEYLYYLKAKITKDEFLEFVDELKLEWEPHWAPNKISGIPWWNPPSEVFYYYTGNGMDYCMQANYVEETGYVYLYIQQF